MTAISVILDRAADVIEAKGWIKSTGWADANYPDRPCCLEGALMWAYDDPELLLHNGRTPDGGTFKRLTATPAYQAVLGYLQSYGAVQYDELYEWNDRGHREKGEVVRLLRDVASVERLKEQS